MHNFSAPFKQHLERDTVAMGIDWSDLLPRKCEAGEPCSEVLHASLFELGLRLRGQ